MQVVRLKFPKEFIKLIEIVAVVRAECVHTQRAAQQHHLYGHTHTNGDFNQFYEIFKEF